MSICKIIYGGRIQLGVYWFIQVLFLSQLIILFIEKNVNRKNVKIFIYLTVFCVAVMESIFIIPKGTNNYPLYLSPPWGIDVSLMSTIFVAAGFYGKGTIDEVIDKLRSRKGWCYCTLGILLFLLCLLLNEKSYMNFILDMKYSHYDNPILIILLPATVFVIVLYFSVQIEKTVVIKQVMLVIGSCSMIIMYIHMPILELFKKKSGEDYSIILYLLGVSVIAFVLKLLSLLFVTTICRWKEFKFNW